MAISNADSPQLEPNGRSPLTKAVAWIGVTHTATARKATTAVAMMSARRRLDLVIESSR